MLRSGREVVCESNESELDSRGTKEIVGGAEVSAANGVPPESAACPARSLGSKIKKERVILVTLP